MTILVARDASLEPGVTFNSPLQSLAHMPSLLSPNFKLQVK